MLTSDRVSFFYRFLAIKPTCLLVLSGCFGLYANAQHPFYLQLLEDGKLAMASQNWEQAKQDLEIASFGFLDKETLLAESYVRLALIDQALGDQESMAAYTRDANLVLSEPPEKPAGLERPYWDAFLILSGRKAAPRPPVPLTENELEGYLQAYPDSGEAWAALIDIQVTNARKSRIRQTIASAVAAVPEDTGVLERALRFSVVQDGERGAEELAARLLILNPTASMANEYMGGLSVKRKAWEEAQAYFAQMTVAQFPKTADYQRQLTEAVNKIDEGGQAENQPPEDLEDPQEDGDEQRASAELEPAVERVPESMVAEPPAEITTEEVEESAPTQEERVANLERLVRTNPSNSEFRFDLADAYLRNGEVRKAKKMLARLAKGNKNHPRYAQIYAHYQYVQGNYQANIDNLSGFINPQGAIAYYLGMSYFQLGETEKARAYLQGLDHQQFVIPQGFEGQITGGSGSGALETRTPTSLSQEEALQWLADQAGQENWQGIHQAMDGIAARYPTDPDVRYFQGRLLMSKGEYQDAMSIFIDLVSQGYGKNEIYYYAGVSALKRGNPSVAQYLFEKAQANDTRFAAEIQSLLRDHKRKN